MPIGDALDVGAQGGDDSDEDDETLEHNIVTNMMSVVSMTNEAEKEVEKNSILTRRQTFDMCVQLFVFMLCMAPGSNGVV